MDISAALALGLAGLSEALDTDADLEATLHDCAAAAEMAVASYLGMTMTIVADGHGVSFTVPEHLQGARKIATSLSIPLTYVAESEAGSSLVLYAATPGAFVDLAADLSYALQVRPDVLVLDAHLAPSPAQPGLDGLAGMAYVNQAIGILIERGDTHEGASAELHRLARLAETSVRVAASRLIQATLAPDRQWG